MSHYDPQFRLRYMYAANCPRTQQVHRYVGMGGVIRTHERIARPTSRTAMVQLGLWQLLNVKSLLVLAGWCERSEPGPINAGLQMMIMPTAEARELLWFLAQEAGSGALYDMARTITYEQMAPFTQVHRIRMKGPDGSSDWLTLYSTLPYLMWQEFKG